MRKDSLVGALALAAALAAFVPVSSILAAPDQHQHEPPAQAAQGGGMNMKMGEMKTGDMMAQQKANTERIDALMAQVKSANGDAKVTAMADVVAILLAERAAMQEHHAAACSMMKK